MGGKRDLIIIFLFISLSLAQDNDLNDSFLTRSSCSQQQATEDINNIERDPKNAKRTQCPPRACSAGSIPARSVTVYSQGTSFALDFFGYCKATFNEAQRICRSRGGRLWEPRSRTEYNAAFRALRYDQRSASPAFLYKNYRGFHFWMGIRTESSSSRNTVFVSDGERTWKSLSESTVGERCVDVFDSPNTWGDHACNVEIPFICEHGRTCEGLNVLEEHTQDEKCQCSIEGRTFDCKSQIGVIDHACMVLDCDDSGTIRLTQLQERGSGNSATQCCLIDGNFILDGDFYSPNRQTTHKCCDGKAIRTYDYVASSPRAPRKSLSGRSSSSSSGGGGTTTIQIGPFKVQVSTG